MKKLFIFLILSIYALYMPVLCREIPEDVPEDHYAYDAIYDLMQRGINVTQGYPDGTFRGNKNTSRYENAYFMAALALSLKGAATYEIDVSEIKEEINWLRNEIKGFVEQPEEKKDLIYCGSVELKSKFGSLFSYDPGQKRAPLGPETNYRFKYSIEKIMGRDAALKINLDTMDGGFNSALNRTFPSNLIDIEGSFIADFGLENPVNVKAAVGPGAVVHRDIGGVAPSDDCTYFSRPRPSFILNTVVRGNDVTAGYAARGVQGNGGVGTSEINLQIGRKLGRFPTFGTTEAVATSRYVFVDFIDPSSGPNIFRQELALFFHHSDSLSQKLMLGASSADHPLSQFYLGLELCFKNINKNGTNVSFLFNSVGEDYRVPFEKLEFVPLNLFDKKILDGTIDIGLEITQALSKRCMLKSKSAWVGNSNWKLGKDVPGTSFTQEISLDCSFSLDLTLNIFYRYYYVPSRIAQFSVPVPEVSDIVGFGLIYQF